MSKNSILYSDLDKIHSDFCERDKLRNSKILVTGCAGFLGYYFMKYFATYGKELQIERIMGLDNFLTGNPDWLRQLTNEHPDLVELYNFDIINDDLNKLPDSKEFTYILHMASVASPTFYRQYPIETLDANIWGLRRLLDFYCNKDLRGFVMFSSSEVYGDPDPAFIPTPEEYRGNVSSIGPRACYDEAKRFSETLCYLYSQKYGMPITLARPFNNYGPGMRLDDKRVPADFAKAIVEKRNIEIFSDGTPTRTFCYVTDAIVGYLKILTYGKFGIYNIGIDRPEISIKDLADIYVSIGSTVFNYHGEAIFSPPPEQNYMTDNPNRRCPNINKAKIDLGFNPSIHIEEGVTRFLTFLKEGCLK